MMDGYIELAKMFKERNKQSPLGAVIGTVITGLPNLTVSIGDEIILDREQLVIGNYLFQAHNHATDNYHTPIPTPLQSGDKVMMIPTANQQIYCVIDKVGG